MLENESYLWCCVMYFVLQEVIVESDIDSICQVENGKFRQPMLWTLIEVVEFQEITKPLSDFRQNM